MRAVTLIAGVLLAATGAAHAADLPPDRDIGLHYPALGRRVAPLVIYDYQPGERLFGSRRGATAVRATLLIVEVLGFAAAAQAQVYTQASLAPGQPYAIEVAPGTYMIQHAGSARAYPYVGCARDCAPVAEPRSSAGRASPRRAHTHNDPALIDELHRKHAKKGGGKCAKSRS